MTEKEFRAVIELVNAELGCIDWGNIRWGVCDAISNFSRGNWATTGSLSQTFSELFSPDGDYDLFWIGGRDKDNISKRRDFLNHFEEYMVVNQYYLAY